MNLICQNPEALYALLLLIPALIIAFVRYKKLFSRVNVLTIKDDMSVYAKRVRHFRIALVFRSLFLSIAWTMLVLAYAGFSWGTYLEPVQRSGSAVSFVFDISYSMNADDAPGGITRLEAAKKYSSMLLSHMENTSISVTLAKGDGVVVIPLTEDRTVVESLFDSLSSSLMSSVGTSLGKGIRASLKSFSKDSAQANIIWVFTDGEETDDSLESALIECVKNGVSVYIIGFGQERETKVLAGDGKTMVQTALRAERMKSVTQNVLNKNIAGRISDSQVMYIDATEPGSALILLEPITKAKNVSDAISSYEVKPVQRYVLFSCLALLFVCLSFIVMELNPVGIAKKIHGSTPFFIVLLVLMLSSCSTSERIKESSRILSGTWDWYQQKYNDAIAKFLQSAFDAKNDEDELVEQYAIYNLAVAYLSQNENESALKRFKQIKTSSPDTLRYSALYNCGVILYRLGDFDSAAKYFRDALKIDGSKLNAKINLELCIKNAEKEAKSRENKLNQVSENNSSNSMQDAIFERIREYDKKQWKNSENTENMNSALDY